MRSWIVSVVGALACVACAKEPTPVPPAPFTQVDVASIDGLVLTAPGGPLVELKKEVADWKLVKPVADGADPRAMADLTAALASLRVGRAVATGPDAYARLGVDDASATTVTTRTQGKDGTTLIVARDGRHLRLAGRAEVFTAEEVRANVFVRDAESLRDRRVVIARAEEIRGVRVVVGTAPALAAKRADKLAAWTLAEGDKVVGKTIDPSAPEQIVHTLIGLEALAREDGRGPAGDADARARFELALGDRTIVVRLGAVDGEATWITVDGAARAAKVPAATLAPLLETTLWRDKLLVDVAAAKVKKLAIAKGKDTVAIEKGKDGKWAFGGPSAPGAPDQAKLQALAAAFQGLRARSAVLPPAAAFTPVAATITLTPAEGAPIVLELGASAAGTTAARVRGGNAGYLSDADATRIVKARADLVSTAPAGHGRGGPMNPHGDD